MDARPTTAPPAEIAGWVRSVAATHDPRVGATTPVFPLLTPALPTRPPIREHSEVYICAGVMVKLHSSHTDPGRLGRRLSCLGGTDLDRLWIQPLAHRLFVAPDGRLGSLWPRVTVLATIDAPPWPRAGALLAGLHRAEVTGDPPGQGGPSRLRRATAWLAANRPDLRLEAVGAELADALARPRRSTWVHGDFHLGQLGHTPLRSSWKLLDADGFGLGDPAWDLGRVAGFRAAGLVDDAAWRAFFDAYREAGGPAVPDDEDGDGALDVLRVPARAALLIVAARQLEAGRDAEAAVLLDAVRRLG
jgi:hypothetical protein